MKIIPLAFDSLGVRSMCCYIETKDVKIVIDPGAALAPNRFGLPPHSIEIDRLTELSSVIEEFSSKSDILTISHYHYDHYEPNATFYSGKSVFVKHPRENINRSQKIERAPFIINRLKTMAKELEYADGMSYEFGSTTMEFSPPVYHGREKSRLGYVLMLAVHTPDQTVIHTSDVQGPIVRSTADWIIERNPDLIILGGPPTYLLGFKLSQENLNAVRENLRRILDQTDAKIIIDHHLLREKDYKERLKDIWDDDRIKTAAEYLGQKNNLLEARRRELWNKKKGE